MLWEVIGLLVLIVCVCGPAVARLVRSFNLGGN
jgi:hypothetical protein